MKCPKCGYLGFDDRDRCKNCGYEFSLVDDPAAVPSGSARPRATPLNLPSTPRPDSPRMRPVRSSRDSHAPARQGALDRPLSRTPDSAPIDLPLFDTEFVAGGSLPPPQRPLAVRRSQSVTPRPRPEAEIPPALPLGSEEPAVSAPEPAPVRHVTRSFGPPAHALSRVAAWIVDVSLLALVDLMTLYFTLRLCGLEPAEWDVLPRIPLVSFFVMLNGGYFVLLTGTLGQTLGKMAMRIEVVADGQAVGIGRAAVRALAAVVSLVPAGVGLLWALFGDHRALHDRLAGTRVVQVTLS